jgi:hypothetical protein
MSCLNQHLLKIPTVPYGHVLEICPAIVLYTAYVEADYKIADPNSVGLSATMSSVSMLGTVLVY